MLAWYLSQQLHYYHDTIVFFVSEVTVPQFYPSSNNEAYFLVETVIRLPWYISVGVLLK